MCPLNNYDDDCHMVVSLFSNAQTLTQLIHTETELYEHIPLKEHSQAAL